VDGVLEPMELAHLPYKNGKAYEDYRALSEAIALYKRSGYAEVKAFSAEPYAHHWFEKTLGKKTQTGRVQ